MHLRIIGTKFRFQNQQGFTLIEALAAIGFLAMVVVSFLAWASTLELGVTNINETSDLNNTMLKTLAAFSDEASCKSNMDANFSQFNRAAASGSPMRTIKYYNGGAEMATVLVVDEKSATIKVPVTKISLVPVMDIDTNRVLANLELTFSKTNGKDKMEVVRRIPLQLLMSGTTIQKCSTSPVSSTLIAEQLCAIQGEGYTIYNPLTGTCSDNGIAKWFNSTDINLATCPEGYKLATNTKSDPYSVCNVYAQHGEDLGDRIYEDGSVDDWQWSIYDPTVDLATNSCHFVYVQGGDTTGYIAQVRCAPK